MLLFEPTKVFTCIKSRIPTFQDIHLSQLF